MGLSLMAEVGKGRVWGEEGGGGNRGVEEKRARLNLMAAEGKEGVWGEKEGWGTKGVRRKESETQSHWRGRRKEGCGGRKVGGETEVVREIQQEWDLVL